MRNENEKSAVLLRTFDLPDIHFSAVTGIDNGEHTFSAERSTGDGELDSMALDRWYKQSQLAADAASRRDCWLQVDGRIYVIWGAKIKARNDVVLNGGSCECWIFSFDEIRRYKPTPS